jgi:hypothetical protein
LNVRDGRLADGDRDRRPPGVVSDSDPVGGNVGMEMADSVAALHELRLPGLVYLPKSGHDMTCHPTLSCCRAIFRNMRLSRQMYLTLEWESMVKTLEARNLRYYVSELTIDVSGIAIPEPNM